MSSTRTRRSSPASPRTSSGSSSPATRTGSSGSMADRRARVGVVGCGWWATHAHLPALAANPDAETVALADPDEANRGAAARAFGVARTFASAEGMFDEVELDACVVAVPHVHHAPVARLALERGLHVLLEKPMTLRPEDGRHLVELARAQGVELVVGYPWHYNGHALS